MPKKKQKANLESPVHPCHVKGCKTGASYKAPKSKTALHDYVWYCLDHIREYNRQWDFFSGMNRDEIEAFMRDAVTGHRPTWSREEKARYYESLQDALDEFLQSQKSKKSPATAGLSAKLREALAAFDMEYPFTAPALKSRYRVLVKRYHPDINKNSQEAEEKFKQITTAYLLLNEHVKNFL